VSELHDVPCADPWVERGCVVFEMNIEGKARGKTGGLGGRRRPWACPTVLGIVTAISLSGQATVAPTNEPTQKAEGTNTSNYNIRQSFEAGYRWETAGGDFDMYRSTVNYTNGIRLLSSSLSVQSLDGHGGLFDQVALNTEGLGNDPYQF